MLTGYKRLRHLSEQIQAIKAQTLKPVEIWLYHNSHRKFQLNEEHVGIDRTITAHPNLGVWPRFMACMEFEADYVCVFDDDTIPGKRWLQNCYESMQEKEGLYGTNGIIFPVEGRRPYQSVGWKQCNDAITQVDIVGHSWFFKRDWLRFYGFFPRPMGTYEETGLPAHFRTCGEDYHFSVVMQRGLGLATYVPPHPKDKPELHGSIRGGLGRDKHALWKKKAEEQAKVVTHDLYRRAGWKLVREGADADIAQPQVRFPGDPANWLSVFREVAKTYKPETQTA